MNFNRIIIDRILEDEGRDWRPVIELINAEAIIGRAIVIRNYIIDRVNKWYLASNIHLIFKTSTDIKSTSTKLKSVIIGYDIFLKRFKLCIINNNKYTDTICNNSIIFLVL